MQTIEVTVASSFWWAVPAVLVLSGIAAICLSLRQISENRSIARKRATLDLIERSESQPYYRELWENFQDVREEDGFAHLVNPANKMLWKQRREVLAFLNHYELVAVGCEQGVLDEKFYADWMKSTVVRDWEAAASFVHTIRTSHPDLPKMKPNPNAFTQLQVLAEKWGAQTQLELLTPPKWRQLPTETLLGPPTRTVAMPCPSPYLGGSP